MVHAWRAALCLSARAVPLVLLTAHVAHAQKGGEGDVLPPPRLLQVSVSTCEDLGWDPITRGSTSVCGENSLGLGGCSGQLTWPEAKSFCESKGARLCSVVDYENDEAFGSSCGYEWKLMWSNTPCAAGYSQCMGPSALVRTPPSPIHPSHLARCAPLLRHCERCLKSASR